MSTFDPFEETFVREQLHFAAQDGEVERVSQLLNDGYPPDVFDELGKTPLHYAAEREHLDVMRLLLEHGADVNAHDERWIGNTTLREVAGNCSFEVAKILVDAGADPTIPGWMQITALQKVQERKDAEGLRVCELLTAAAKRFVATSKT
ncbi:MAG TPA: ankyrin repeat domain-containing protein [Pyrinomonadaceae bacterium]